MEQKAYKPAFRGDAWNATFMQMIILNPAHPDNRQATLQGYSKEMRTNESPDKCFVLMQMLRRSAFKYLFDGRALEVKVYKRPDRRFHWDDATHILTLKLKEPVILSHVDVSNKVVKFLESAYLHLAKGQLFDEKPKSSLAGKKKLEVLDVYRQHKDAFPTEEALKTFCRSWVDDGVAQEIMHKFFFDYKNRWLN